MAATKRAHVLQFAVLGLLHEGPMHGYELRKRLNSVLGTFRAISYGSLYPCLKEMLAAGLIAEDGPADAGAPALSGRRARIVYKLTPEGKDRFQEWLADAGPEAYEDELFGVTSVCASCWAGATGSKNVWPPCATTWPSAANVSTNGR